MQRTLCLFKHFSAKMIEFIYLETSLLAVNSSGRCNISISTLTRANIRYTWGRWLLTGFEPSAVHNSDENHWCRFFFSSRLSSSYRPSSLLPFPSSIQWRDRSALEKRFRDEKFQYDLNSAPDTSRYSRNGTCAS